MQTSVNCAMELAMLYNLFAAGGTGVQLVVLNDEDVILDDMAALAARIGEKSSDQLAQAALFKAAYERCHTFLQSHFAKATGLHDVSELWLRDFEAAGGGQQARRRLSLLLPSTSAFAQAGNSADFGHENPMLEEMDVGQSQQLPVHSI